ncbi:hypothetical protein NDU88_001391 [Pleurodeles waltl]|uniref:Uncharacterized protein n=1 Tax=Pleurodeles waltl TaxID=8319 RepID=A0AAV7NAL9_PLEWA|nr:hypothetical protein NDU88_001391 [Pleurodeles waltl]
MMTQAGPEEQQLLWAKNDSAVARRERPLAGDAVEDLYFPTYMVEPCINTSIFEGSTGAHQGDNGLPDTCRPCAKIRHTRGKVKKRPRRLEGIRSGRGENKRKRLKRSATVGMLEAAKLPQTRARYKRAMKPRDKRASALINVQTQLI